MSNPLARLALVVSLVCGATFAQSEIGGATLNGTVLDPTGAAVPNAKVIVTNSGTGVSRNTQSNDTGLYSFPRLPVGSYDLTIEAAGFKSSKRTGVMLNVGAVVTLDVNLEVGAAQETVSVTAEVPVVESTRSTTATTVTEQQVRALPINGRNFLDFTVLTPGVVRDQTRGGDLSFGGQRGTSNSLLVDGADSNNVFFGQTTGRTGTGRNPYSFSEDAVQEFQVNTNGYAAEIGRAGGGVINVITKSGTNEFHGTAFEFFRDKALNANSWENNRAGRAKRAYHFNQFGGNLGGPIAKNRAFFFFNYDGQRNTTPNPIILTVLPAASDAAGQQGLALLQPYTAAYSNALNNDVYLGKVDLELSSNHRLSVRYNGNRFVGQNFENTGQASAAEHTGNSKVTTDSVAGSHTWILGTNSVLESRLSWTRDNEPGESNSTAPEAVIRERGTTVLSIGRNNFSPRYTNAKTFQWIESLSRTVGRHSLKFGYDMNLQRIANFFPGNFSGSYTFNSYADFANKNPFSFTQGFAGSGTTGPLTEPNVGEFALFAQDSWRASDRLTLNYGVRYDYFKLAQPPVKNPDTQLAALGLDTSKIPLDANNIAPRFGFAYKLNGARHDSGARWLRDVLRAYTVHRHRDGVLAERNPGADLHAELGLSGVSEYPERAARCEPPSGHLRVRARLRTAADAPVEPQLRAAAWRKPGGDARLPGCARHAPHADAGHKPVPAGGDSRHVLRHRCIGDLPAIPGHRCRPAPAGQLRARQPLRQRRGLRLPWRVHPTDQALLASLPVADLVHVFQGPGLAPRFHQRRSGYR